MPKQAGAQWLAHEQQEIGADDPDATEHIGVRRADDLPRFPITDLMSIKSLIAWHEIVTDAHKYNSEV